MPGGRACDAPAALPTRLSPQFRPCARPSSNRGFPLPSRDNSKSLQESRERGGEKVHFGVQSCRKPPSLPSTLSKKTNKQTRNKQKMPAFNLSKEAVVGTAALGVVAVAGFLVGRRYSGLPFGTPKSRFSGKNSPLQQYVLDHSLREHPALKKLRLVTSNLPNKMMMVSTDQAQLMANLARLIKAKKVIEVGVFTGYNALNMALVIPEDGRVVACDISEDYANIGKPVWKEARVDHKIDLRIKPAIQTLDELLANGEAGTFDFAFIDADKNGYNDYYERCLQLVRKGGIIAIDNVLWSGRVLKPAKDDLDSQHLHQLNEKIFRDPRVNISMLPIGDGVTLAFKL